MSRRRCPPRAAGLGFLLAISVALSPGLTVAGELLLPGRIADIGDASGRLLVAARQAGLQVVRRHPSGRLEVEATIALAGEAVALDTDGRLVAVADLETVSLFRIDADGQPRPAGSLQVPGTPTDVALACGRAYVTDMQALLVFDVSAPEPRLLKRLDLPGAPHVVAVRFPYAYVAGGGSLDIVDVAENRLGHVGSLPLSCLPQRITVRETLVLMACGASGVLLADVGRPHSPRLVDRIGTAGEAVDVGIHGDEIVVAELDAGFGFYRRVRDGSWKRTASRALPGPARVVHVDGRRRIHGGTLSGTLARLEASRADVADGDGLLEECRADGGGLSEECRGRCDVNEGFPPGLPSHRCVAARPGEPRVSRDFSRRGGPWSRPHPSSAAWPSPRSTRRGTGGR